MTKTKQVTSLRLTPELKKIIDSAAKAKGKSVTEVITDAIRAEHGDSEKKLDEILREVRKISSKL